MSTRFTGGVLTTRTGRDDGLTGEDVTVPTSAIRDEQTGQVFAFPIQVDPRQLEDQFNAADDEGVLASEAFYPDGAPDGPAWMPEHEPYTFVDRDTYVKQVQDDFLDLIESLGSEETA